MALSLKPIEIVEKNEYPLLVKAPHWERVFLREIAEVQNGFAFKSSFFSKDKGIPLIRIRDIYSNNTESYYIGEYEEEYLVNDGDILIGMDGDFNAAIWKGRQGLLNQRVCRVICFSELYSEKFLFLCLQPYLNVINAETSSITVKHLSSQTVEDIPLPLPPLKEQFHIVAKIEELFSELDKGIEYLKTAREQLKVHRQSVLKYAFEGKLTQQWREAHADQLETADQLLERIRQEREDLYQQQMNEWEETIKAWEENGKEGKKPRQPQQLKKIFTLSQQRLSILPQLPKGWSWVCSGNFFHFVTSGSRGWAKYYSEGGAIFLRITNLNFDSLEVDLSPDKIQYVQPPSNQEGTRTYVEEGDFLFSITGYLGMFAIAPSLQEAYVNQHIALARPLHSFNKKFVGYYITSRTGGFHHLNQLTKGAVKAGLTLTDVTSFPVPLCSIEEQGEIVNLIEMQLSHIYELDKNIEANLRQAEVLRQNILKKAFSGQLLPQDPNNEPASVLLQRIRAERQSVPKPTRKPSTSRKKTRRKDMANLLSVLESANNWLSAQDVFQECGVSDGAETEVIEKLYLDLRDLVKENRIEVARRGDEDWLRILPTGRS